MPGRTRPIEKCRITCMTPADIAFAVSLTDREGWGFFGSDFETRLRLYPSGSFVARHGRESVGMISSVTYGTYAYLGNLIVREGHRGHGIGAELMLHAVNYLLGKGVTTIELDGVWGAVTMYRKLGFRDKHLSLRFSRPADKRAVEPMNSAIPATPIIALDRKLVGVARQRLLRAALTDRRNSLVVQGSPVSAYALIRERAGGFSMVAPIIAPSWRQVPPLVDSVIKHYGDRPLWVGVPEPNYRMSQFLLSCGFVSREPSLRMYYGTRLNYEKHVYGIFGPAIG
ncbi:hypothetical protein C3F09_12925 [candidate division GN15 bacterium]|uniref:N-acetyltransferase domain-containing protein n=1 Tax=candidate division GN15 bacterium TaxID=2072418 RepID=A0A855WYW1_9BACT|nr:MAG: hypothetical protein C3F09_12925 [candidate division GN15 bacterium]